MEQINFSDFEALCYKSKEPIFITKNGQESLVLIKEQTYKDFEKNEVFSNVAEGYLQCKNRQVVNGKKTIQELKQLL